MSVSEEELPTGDEHQRSAEAVPDPNVPTMHVVAIPVVKDGITTLKERRIHELFPAYLEVRRLAASMNPGEEVRPDWHEVARLLDMPGGPPNKPNYRPFSSTKKKSESGYWYNKNLAGSYAPSSIRTTAGFMVDDGKYVLPVDHATQALAKLLYGKRVPAWALAAFYLRNDGFVFAGDGGLSELISAFKHEFAFDQGADFGILFDDAAPDSPPATWFEPFTQPEEVSDADSGDGEPDD
ncbi:hypothetical protein LJ114_02585 [Propionibacterium freudenreichii]|uniref:hypothetical protein n=1 Tax=Propionibacterium freudenreichii TaxID=1744 RepID=UPI0005439C8A|nr:hypothetical protein [Propionibacterium freudenreichii]WBF62341.1 hypothetical protein LJ114_02585 [Propionibacterium freudenreichii]CEG92085.1 Putative uncharacterized protein [Propionibacterium freudenreichii]CEH02170.1 Putative uncharacterized protein [Propionibacterium freudenreichii]